MNLPLSPSPSSGATTVSIGCMSPPRLPRRSTTHPVGPPAIRPRRS
ncbi:hypothetical protein AB0E59_19110 [Lentzea sp. NPDC034063]